MCLSIHNKKGTFGQKDCTMWEIMRLVASHLFICPHVNYDPSVSADILLVRILNRGVHPATFVQKTLVGCKASESSIDALSACQFVSCAPQKSILQHTSWVAPHQYPYYDLCTRHEGILGQPDKRKDGQMLIHVFSPCYAYNS